jgi:hypothetical protein
MKLYKITINHRHQFIDLDIIKEPSSEEFDKIDTMEVNTKEDIEILHLQAINKREAYYVALMCMLEIQKDLEAEKLYQDALYNGIKRG